jgi:hypothetical protein
MAMTQFLTLRRVLIADAVSSLGAALLMTLGAAPLAAPTGLPAGLLREGGLILLPFAGLAGFLGS